MPKKTKEKTQKGSLVDYFKRHNYTTDREKYVSAQDLHCEIQNPRRGTGSERLQALSLEELTKLLDFLPFIKEPRDPGSLFDPLQPTRYTLRAGNPYGKKRKSLRELRLLNERYRQNRQRYSDYR